MTQFIDNLFSHLWSMWVLIAVTAAILEMVLPSFSFALGSVAAVAAALVALRAGLSAQILVFSVVLIVVLLMVRPRLIRRMHLRSAPSIPSRAQALLGKTGQVTELIAPTTKSGRVLVEGQDWAAQSDQVVEPGKTVVVDGSDGIVLTVKEI